MNKKLPLGIGLAVLLVAIAATYSITMHLAMNHFNRLAGDLPDRIRTYRELDELDQLVRQNYFQEINEQFLNDSLMKGYVSGLKDPYGFYLPQSEVAAYENNLAGKGSGVGFVLLDVPHPTTQHFYVTQVYSGGPAASAGLQAGDQIVQLEGKPVSDMTVEDARKIMTGANGSSLTLTVLRGEEQLALTIVRGDYEVETVLHEKKGSIGYIRILHFRDNTRKQFEKALSNLQNQQVQSLILDVRSSNSSQLSAAAEVLDLLVPTGTTLYAQHADGSKEAVYTSDANDVTLPMMVLVNSQTKGAGELLACDLRDFSKARLVGTQTGGRGVMQRLFPLADGSAVNLTIAKFLPAKSANFDQIGLTPDYLVAMDEADLPYLPLYAGREDEQYKKAVELLTNAEETVQ